MKTLRNKLGQRRINSGIADRVPKQNGNEVALNPTYTITRDINELVEIEVSKGMGKGFYSGCWMMP